MYLMLLQSALFILVWTAIHLHVARHGPVQGARTFIWVNSWLYAVASGGMLVLILLPDHDLLARKIYHISKFYEYVDVLAVRATGGVIDLHFAVHHLTTPYLTYVRVLRHSQGWQVFAALNTFHHVLMYAFFGGASMFRPILPVTGTVQLAVGVAGETWILANALWRGDDSIWPHVCALGLLCTYSVLWTRELLQKVQLSPKEKQV